MQVEPAPSEAPAPSDPAIPLWDSHALVGMLGTIGVLVVACVIGMSTLQDNAGWTTDDVRQIYVGAPYGYTWSLAIYVVPVVAILLWYARSPQSYAGWGSVGRTVAVIVPLWSLVDVLLANTFFTFPNPAATLRIFVPGWSFDHGWERDIPIEEFGFYLFGCLVIVLNYRWAGHFWFPHHDKSQAQYREVARNAASPRAPDVMVPILVGAAVFGAGLLYKYYGDHPFQEGFPGYLLFLVMLVAVPTAIAFHVVRYVMNVRAFLLTTVTLAMTSLLWEVTLALPHGWWDFRHQQMVGLFITPWTHLPIEEPLLWLAAAWSNVTLYEFWRLVVDGRQSPLAVLLGRRAS